jgi:arginyl-tRNA synthetase
METIASQLDSIFRRAIKAAFDLDSDPIISVSQTEKFGDYQSNAAMGLAKQVAEKTGQKTNPRSVAEQIKAKLVLGEMASEVSIAGPGFINVKLNPAWLAKTLMQVENDPRDGAAKSALPQKVVVDYSAPNVAKELHVGHIRSTIIGDALARVLEFEGDEVVRQNHIGDWGTQFGMLLTHLRESAVAQSSETHISDLEDFYRAAKKRFDEDEKFQDVSRKTVVQLQSGDPETLALWQRIIEETRRHFQPLYEQLNVTLRREHERGESFYNPYLAEVVKELRDKGIAVESEGAIVVWVEGFEAPLIIQKSGGGFGYATTDLAAMRFRVRELGAKRLVYVTDSRQIQHFRQVIWTARQAGWIDGIEVDHVTFGTILGEDNKPFKSRSGDTIKLKELLDEAEERAFSIVTEKSPGMDLEQRKAIAHAVGVGAIKYYDLARDRNNDYVFSWEKMLSFDGNTAPYLQNAYVRICSIFRKADEKRGEAREIVLESPYEVTLAKHVLRLGEVLQLVSRELKPHHLTTYLYELAGKFHSFYEHCDVIKSDEPVRSSRLGLCDVTAKTLARGLDLLGIEHPEQM